MIRKMLIGALGLCLLMAVTPAAMATDPAPDVCVLDLTPSADHLVASVADTAQVCSVAIPITVAQSEGGDDDEAAAVCPGVDRLPNKSSWIPSKHFDPGRCSG